MREILFRGQTCGGKWVEGSLHIEYGETTKDGERKTDYRILGMRGECTYIIHETIGQYTGLTDKNGKKIFEGDIIGWNDGELDETGKPYEDEISEILFCEERKAFIQRSQNAFEDNLEGLNREFIRVLGNIHDNPELLKGGADND